MVRRGGKQAQVWVETVIYTLIALTIIGVFLSFAKPKIEEIQDKAIIEQSIEMLEDINKIILNTVEKGSGNQRKVEVGIKKGFLLVNGTGDQLLFEIDGKYPFSEPGDNGAQGPKIPIGNLLVTTKEIGNVNTVTLISNYGNKYNITYHGKDQSKVLSRSPSPYRIVILNRGDTGGLNQIDISII